MSAPPSEPAGLPVLERLTRRGQFLAAARKGGKAVTPGMVVQALAQTPATKTASEGEAATPPAAIRFGLTASRKVGGAVVRNRARRRLRALAVELLPQHGVPGTDYVLIARAGTVERPHAELRADLLRALARLRRPATPAPKRRERPGRREDAKETGAGRREA